MNYSISLSSSALDASHTTTCHLLLPPFNVPLIQQGRGGEEEVASLCDSRMLTLSLHSGKGLSPVSRCMLTLQLTDFKTPRKFLPWLQMKGLRAGDTGCAVLVWQARDLYSVLSTT